MGVIKKFMIQGILEIDSQTVKTTDEAREIVEETMKRALYPEQGEKFKVRRVEKI